MDLPIYGALKKYIDDTLVGGGALKGKNCTIPSIETITGGHRVNFEWTLDNGTVETGYIDVLDGVNGRDGHDGTTCQWETLPEANQEHVGMIAQYIGATSGTLVNGYFYKCVENDGVYSWEASNTQDAQGKNLQAPVTVGGQTQSTVEGAIGALAGQDDSWTATAQVDSNSVVTFTGLNDAYGYALYAENVLVAVASVTKTGSGNNVTLAYTVSGAEVGTVCKLRILK